MMLDTGSLGFQPLRRNLTPVAVTRAWTADLEGDARDELLLATNDAYEPRRYWRLELFRLVPAPLP
ncbi:hypothetical protein ACN28S_65280 [Cystobacter fuscus]